MRDDERGAAAIEFAYVLPMMAALVSGGIETTNYVWTRTQVSELALHAADHASRMGSAAVLSKVPVTEANIKDVLIGTALQGESVNLRNRGRVIISSLQQNATGGQWIAWQRCLGDPKFKSSDGPEGTGLVGNSFKGMGSQKITARNGQAVMFAEIFYEYDPLFPLFEEFVPQKRFSETAAFTVRDDRDLSTIYPVTGVVADRC